MVRQWLSRRLLDLRREDGIALIMVLGLMLVFTVTTVTAVNMATATTQTAANSNASQDSVAYAEGAMNAVASTLYQRATNGQDPTSPTLFGCAAGTSGASDCTTYTPVTYCLTSSSCTAGNAGTASVYGWFSGTNPGTFNGTSVAASTWLIYATGYGAGANSTTPVSRTVKATIKVNAMNSGAVAAVWNHIFLTAPLVNNVCQTTLGGTNQVINAPMYVIGNLCITGNRAQVLENGQAVDLEVGGKLVLPGNQATVGASSTSPITSGVVVGGCATSITGTASSCTSGSWPYWVKSTDTWSAQSAPSESTADQEQDYTNFDPGPKHPCLSGTNPAPPTGGTTGLLFDSTISTGEGTSAMAPDNSGSNTGGGVFDLTPSSSYACISQNGTSTGYLIWNNSSTSSLTVSGITVPAKTLAINGNIFFDSGVTASQTMTYTGTAAIEFAGTFTTGATICAVWKNGNCDTASGDWQGGSGNTSMLTLTSLVASNSSALSFTSTNGTFQGSLWTQPSSATNITGTNYTIEGPMSMGSLYFSGTNANLLPLPVIKNMPTGAPVPPNTGVTISAPSLLG